LFTLFYTNQGWFLPFFLNLPLLGGLIFNFVAMSRRNNLVYWWCQVGGWFSYGLTMIFFAFIFDSKPNPIFYPRLGITIVSGILFTHLFRSLIIGFKLRPPFPFQKWWLLVILFFSVVVFYSLTNSALVEWVGLYDPKIKFSVSTRFFSNLIFDSPMIFIWVSIYYVWHYVQLGRMNEIQKVRLETLVKELELKTIKAHINPHFIFNALNSIRALVDENPERARTAITELSNILRSSMQAEKLETVTLEKELSIVKDYLALETIRFESRLRVVYHIDEDTLDQPVPPMMLQTLVENAIKHGIGKQREGGVVEIWSEFENDQHQLIIKNTGAIEDDLDIDNSGFGVSSTKNRLALLFGDKANFFIQNTKDHMVEAVVRLPLAPNNK
jgi:two-component sensor histidine kinase